MRQSLSVVIHPSAFPAAESERVGRSIRAGSVPQSLHYQGAAQATRWQALYERWSPFANRPEYRTLFEQCFAETAGKTRGGTTVIGLGCGTGAKDIALIRCLLRDEMQIGYAPVDISLPLVTTAALAARELLHNGQIRPLVADLAPAGDLDTWLAAELPDSSTRLFTFFSMLPNFLPGSILPRIARWLRPEDRLLISINLVSGPDVDAGVQMILPQYDNAETRSWLFTFLEQGGIRAEDGELVFGIEPCSGNIDVHRIVARWRWKRASRLHVLADAFDFMAGDELELFFSCRYQAENLPAHFIQQGLAVETSWPAPDGEEVIYLCRATGS